MDITNYEEGTKAVMAVMTYPETDTEKYAFLMSAVTQGLIEIYS